MFNSQNWIVFAPDYRNDWFGSEETDLVDAVRFAATLPNADPDRIAVFGGSNGGRVSLRAAITDPTALRCLAIGSPFLTDPDVFFARDTTRPPWSLLSSGANAWISATRDRLILAAGRSAQRQSLTRDELFMQRSIVRNAGKIRAPVLLMTSRADEQVPHVMLESLIGALETAGRPARVVTVEKSLHGFYWGREGEFGAREGRGPRTAEQLEEETRVRDEALEFLSHCLGSPARH
jgi:dipeptidyl aminopeptidase/acylaminoacyl peptidase